MRPSLPTVSTADVPASLLALAQRIEGRLAEVLDAEEQRWSELDADLAAPVAEVGRMVLGGGKRLRPAFAYWGFIGAGGSADDQRIIDVGAAFELMHAFALFHDDVMDDADTRRGRPTTHTVFAEEHRRGHWAGEARRFGEGVAILVGDLAFVFADRLLRGLSAEAWDIWNELRIELNIGQFLDIQGSVRHERRLEKAERICRYKSGKYTIERPLHLGAVIADPDAASSLLPLLSGYGLPLGDAFQLRDDVMGAFGDEEITGKPVGGDLREGKPTPLLARAVAAANGVQQRVLDMVGTEIDDEHVAHIQQVIVDTGALDETEAAIARLTGEALAALERIPYPPEVIEELAQLARYVSERKT